LFKWLFKKEKEIKCVHDLEEIGKFYSDLRTIYNNCSDCVEAYELSRCKLCGETVKKSLLEKRFPAYMYGENYRRDKFVSKLEANGFKNYEDYVLGIEKN